MSDLDTIYGNVGALSGRTTKKKQASGLARHLYAHPVRQSMQPPQNVAAIGLPATARQIDKEWSEAKSQWWDGFYEVAPVPAHSFKARLKELKALLMVPHHGTTHDELHQSYIELPAGVNVTVSRLSSMNEEEAPKKPLNWGFKVYAREIKSAQGSFRLLSSIAADSQIKVDVVPIDEPSPEKLATDESLGSKLRFNAILDWLHDDKAAASKFILNEIPKATDSWRDALVHAAMDSSFDSPDEQTQLANMLLGIATDRKEDTDASASSVTRAAILRAGSVLGSSDTDRFRSFLGESKTNLVALVALVRIVTNHPPSLETENNENLVEDLRNIVSLYTNPMTYRRGDIDAALFNALNLLAVYSDEQFVSSLDDLEKLKKPYLFEQLREELVELSRHPKWKQASQSKAGKNLVRAIKAVHQKMG